MVVRVDFSCNYSEMYVTTIQAHKTLLHVCNLHLILYGVVLAHVEVFYLHLFICVVVLLLSRNGTGLRNYSKT